MVLADPDQMLAATMHVEMKEQNVEYTRSAAQVALDDLATAEAALIEAADGRPVTHADATEVWRAAADLDLAALNARRADVIGLQDHLWRAEAAQARAADASEMDNDRRGDAIAEPESPDYGALASEGHGPPMQEIVSSIDVDPSL